MLRTETLLLVLGSPNSPSGELGPIALSRIDLCQQLYTQQPSKLVLTGGFGSHFNTSTHPHAFYLRQALLGRGVSAGDILALVESSHSVEDATLSKWIIEAYKPSSLLVVTSDFHVERAKIIFEAVYAPFNQFVFAGAPSEHIDSSLIAPLVQHEKVAVRDLREHGVRF